MRVSNRKLASAGRLLRCSFAFACVAWLLPGSITKADTVLQFAQAVPTDVVTATASGGVTTLSTAGNLDTDPTGSSMLVTVTNYLGVPGVNFLAYETFVGVHSVGSATLQSFARMTYVVQEYAGAIAFTSGPGDTGANYLTATFTDAGFTGLNHGAQANLADANPPGSLTLTSDFATFGAPLGMALSFSGIPTPPGLHIAGATVASTTAQNAGTFSGSAVPEPSTFAIAGLGALGMIGYGLKRRRKALGA